MQIGESSKARRGSGPLPRKFNLSACISGGFEPSTGESLTEKKEVMCVMKDDSDKREV